MKKFSLSILLGIISILSIYASSDVELPIIDLTCNYKDSDNLVIDKRPRTPECSPRVYQNKNYCCPLKTKKSPIMCPQCP